jgi:hypothetical protein
MTRGIPAQSELDHLRQHLASAAELEVAHGRLGLDRARSSRLGHEEDRARRMALLQPGEDALRLVEPLRGGPHDVRHRARAQLWHLVRRLTASLSRQFAFDLGDDAHRRQCLRQERPSR